METIVYLDTHVVVFLYAGLIDKIGKKARIAIEKSEVRISPIVVMELQYLYETGRTNVPAEPVIKELAEAIGLTVCDMDFIDVCFKALEVSWTRDPFDRLIVAHAMLAEAPLITKDRFIRRRYDRALWN